MEITYTMCKQAYPIAKKVWEGTLTRNDAKYEINRYSGMTLGSAQIFITIFLAMMEGTEYTRAFNNDGNNLLFDEILADYGEKYYINALSAAEKHVGYYATLGKGNLVGLSNIIKKRKEQFSKDGGFHAHTSNPR